MSISVSNNRQTDRCSTSLVLSLYCILFHNNTYTYIQSSKSAQKHTHTEFCNNAQSFATAHKNTYREFCDHTQSSAATQRVLQQHTNTEFCNHIHTHTKFYSNTQTHTEFCNNTLIQSSATPNTHIQHKGQCKGKLHSVEPTIKPS